MNRQLDRALVAAAPLTAAGVDWMVAGGWAIDLFLGRITRDHADVDLAVWRDQQGRLRNALPAWTFVVADAGVLRPWPDGEWLAPPRHEIHAAPADADATLEFLLNDRDKASWIYRRDTAIRRQLARVRHQRSGIPYLAPELVLLYKSKTPRAADERDSRAVAPALEPDSRCWLHQAIARSSPTHPWLAHLRHPEA